MAKKISFADARTHRAKEVTYYTMELNPEDLGLHLTPDEMGVDESGKPNKTVEIRFRPFEREEYNDVLEQIKDEEGKAYIDERDIAIVMMCVVEPEIPLNAEGRKWVEAWLPGTVANVRQQIEEHSGYRRNYLVQKATDVLGPSGNTTRTSTSTSK